MFSFTREVDCSLLLVSALANRKGEYMSLKTVAREKKLPYRFLGKIIIPLKKAGIVESAQGTKGGYRLAKEARDIKVSDILAAYKEEIAPVKCLRETFNKCSSHDICDTKDFWRELHESMQDVVKKYNVNDFTNNE